MLLSYVDAYRMVAVQLHGTHTDLKNIIQQSGMKLNMTDMNPGEPNDETFVKQVLSFARPILNSLLQNLNNAMAKIYYNSVSSFFLGEISHQKV